MNGGIPEDRMSEGLPELLEMLRRAEKEQALQYRKLASEAEESHFPELAQRFHDLHADEQHHLSRLTARLLEIGGRPADLGAIVTGATELADWRDIIGSREDAELLRYRKALQQPLDSVTRALLEGIAAVEEHHRDGLGGKWTLA